METNGLSRAQQSRLARVSARALTASTDQAERAWKISNSDV
jgi:hypothetical protein